MKKAKVTQAKNRPFEGKAGLFMLFAGLICTLFLLKQQIDRKQIEDVPTISSLSSAPENPVERVNNFIDNVQKMPKTDKHYAFIAYAEKALSDDNLTPIEYNHIKSEHHLLQKEALAAIPKDAVNLNVDDDLKEAKF